ncbi:MAG: hypothetical protein GX029_11870 [Pseudomonadaceae bacterium]|nr:hypothetical protein [Pseudomonadaceae bacterium]
MKVYLYLNPLQLDVLRHARLHLSEVSDLLDPYQNNARMIQRQAIRVSEADFQKELERQFNALPPQLKGLMTWEMFQLEAQKKRPKIEQQMKKGREVKPAILPNPEAYQDLAMARFSKRPDNPLLWERWADQHRGLVLELDTTYPGFNSKKQVLRPMAYGQARPQADHPMKPFPALFHRPAEYAQEEEIRLIRPLDEAKSSKPLTNGKLIHFYNFPPRAILSVTLGVNVSEDTREQISRILNYDIKYKPGRPLRETLLDPDTFKLHIRGTL